MLNLIRLRAFISEQEYGLLVLILCICLLISVAQSGDSILSRNRFLLLIFNIFSAYALMKVLTTRSDSESIFVSAAQLGIWIFFLFDIAQGLNFYFGPDVSFVYFCDADEAAHVFSAVGVEYVNAIERVDRHLARLKSLIETRVKELGEKWLLVVTTDHGHIDEGGHGGDNPQEKASFVIAVGLGRENPHWAPSIAPEDLTPLLLAERA